MTYAPWILAVLLAALSFYLWRKPNMDIATLNTKLAAAKTAADNAKSQIAAKDAAIAAKDAEIADLKANQTDQAALQAAADLADAIIADLP